MLIVLSCLSWPLRCWLERRFVGKLFRARWLLVDAGFRCWFVFDSACAARGQTGRPPSSLRWFVFDSTCSRANGSPSFFVALELSARVLGLNKPSESNVMVYSYNIIGRRPSSLLHDTQDQSRHWHSLSLFCSVPSVVSWVVHNINSVPVR